MTTVATTTLVTELPSAAATPTASTNSGKAMIVSMSREMTAIGPAARPTGGRAESRTDRQRKGDRDDRYRQVHARGGEDAAKYVAAERVGSEGMGERRRPKALGASVAVGS